MMPGQPPQPGQPPGPPPNPQLQQAQAQLQQIQSQLEKIQENKQILALLRDEKTRGYRIEIETDSTVEPDEQAEKQKRLEFLESSTKFVQQALPMLQIFPQAAPLIAQQYLFLVRGFRAGREMEDTVEQVMQAIGQAASQPKPSPEEQKLALEQKAMEAEQQFKAQDAQMRQQEGQQKLQLEQQKHEQEMQFEQQKMAMEIQKLQMEMAMLERKQQGEMAMEQQRSEQELAIRDQEARAGQEMMREEHGANMEMSQEQHESKLRQQREAKSANGAD